MSKKIQFYTKHPNKPRCGVEHTIHQDSELYILWYYLYRIDKIILSNNNYEKTTHILQEPLDKHDYINYTQLKLKNSFIGRRHSGTIDNKTILINNYSDFIDNISKESYLKFKNHTPNPRPMMILYTNKKH